MSPAPSSDPVEEQNPKRDPSSPGVRNGVAGAQEDRRRLLSRKGRATPTIIPLAMTPAHPTLSPVAPTSPHNDEPHLPAAHAPSTKDTILVSSNSTYQTECLLANPEDLRGDGEEEGRVNEGASYKPAKPRRVRDLAAFWLLGFCNNFTYWVMITAAYDLIAAQDQGYGERSPPSAPPNASLQVTARRPGWTNDSLTTFTCHGHSTAAILLADTLPATALTLAAPFILLVGVGVGVRVALLTLLCVASYLVLGLASPTLVFLGVALASASRGFSDTTFLSYTSHYHKHVLSLWASGTGVATFVGPLLFSAMTTGGLHPRHALLTFLAVPLLIVVSFWCVLSHPQPLRGPARPHGVDGATLVCEEEREGRRQKVAAGVKEKIFLWRRAQKYLLPMSAFYFIMYVTNQGLLELVYFPGSGLSHGQQYSWSITARCLGTLVARSTHKLFRLHSTWLYSLLALVIMGVVGTEAHYHYLPSEYIVFALLLVQGLAEGATYTATIFTLHKKTTEEEREFSLSLFPAYMFLPAILAGFVSIPIHDFLCQHNLYSN